MIFELVNNMKMIVVVVVVVVLLSVLFICYCSGWSTVVLTLCKLINTVNVKDFQWLNSDMFITLHLQEWR